MLIANVQGRRLHARYAESGQLGTCPFTGRAVKAHVGPHRQFWVYRDGIPPLPPGYEGETQWHYAWKHLVADDFCEVVYGANREHRADIVGAHETVVELQHSPIDSRIAAERSEFYAHTTKKRVIWLIDASEYAERIALNEPKKGERFGEITWKHPRLWVKDLATDPNTHVYLDPKFVGDSVMKIWIYRKVLYGYLLPKRDFFIEYLAPVAKPEYADFSFLRYNVWRIYDS